MIPAAQAGSRYLRHNQRPSGVLMVVPLIGRSIAAAVGALLVLTAVASVVGTLIVPRPVGGRLTRWIDGIVNGAFHVATVAIADYRRRDRVLATQAAGMLIAQLIAWLGIFFIGYSLLLWPFVPGGVTSSFITAGTAVWAFGSVAERGAAERAILDVAALTGIVTVTLQIAYLPTLYSSFNRRETEVALLNARAGVPSWGPELLARTHYALGSGVSAINTLPDLYAQWERWASDVAESHTTYLPLVRFRSPRPLSSWVTGLLAVLDSAALFLALSPNAAATVPGRPSSSRPPRSPRRPCPRAYACAAASYASARSRGRWAPNCPRRPTRMAPSASAMRSSSTR